MPIEVKESEIVRDDAKGDVSCESVMLLAL
jgi:hypothetical protein